jgi:hypothetical protein
MARYFDTLKLARALRDEAGFTGPHAEAAAVALADAMEAELVTKRDLDEAVAAIEARFVGIEGKIVGIEGKIVGLDAKIDKISAELRAELKAELAKLQVSMMKWVFAMVGGATVLQIASTFLRHG